MQATQFTYKGHEVEIRKIPNRIAGYYFDTYVDEQRANSFSMFARNARIAAKQLIDAEEKK